MKNKVHVMISNRHMHLNREALDILFGEGYTLTVKRPMAPPIFAANETVTLQGPKGKIEGVRILGPLRSYNQVEILRADNFVLGSRAEVKISGSPDLAPLTVIGPKGKISTPWRWLPFVTSTSPRSRPRSTASTRARRSG